MWNTCGFKTNKPIAVKNKIKTCVGMVDSSHILDSRLYFCYRHHVTSLKKPLNSVLGGRLDSRNVWTLEYVITAGFVTPAKNI
jgi:hypothetical protein